MQPLAEIIELNQEVKLEKIASKHTESLFAQIDRHRDYLSDFVHWTRFTHKVEDTQQFIQLCHRESETGDAFVWAICKNNKAVGTISLNKPIDWQNRIALIGYWLSPEAQGNGIVTQAVNAMMNATQAHFSTYILRCAVHNERSNKVAQRCGFTFVETQENAEKIGEVVYAQHIYHKVIA